MKTKKRFIAERLMHVWDGSNHVANHMTDTVTKTTACFDVAFDVEHYLPLYEEDPEAFLKFTYHNRNEFIRV